MVIPSKGTWYCFAAQTGGDRIKLASHILEPGQRDSAERIADHLLTTVRESVSKPRQKPQDGLQPLPYLEHAHAAVEAVGFDPDHLTTATSSVPVVGGTSTSLGCEIDDIPQR